jgi:hypothetical protein
MSYKFIKVKDPENRFETTDIEFKVETSSLLELIQEFEYFLKGCGFAFDGTLEIVEPEDAFLSEASVETPEEFVPTDWNDTENKKKKQ